MMSVMCSRVCLCVCVSVCVGLLHVCVCSRCSEVHLLFVRSRVCVRVCAFTRSHVFVNAFICSFTHGLDECVFVCKRGVAVCVCVCVCAAVAFTCVCLGVPWQCECVSAPARCFIRFFIRFFTRWNVWSSTPSENDVPARCEKHLTTP